VAVVTNLGTGGAVLDAQYGSAPTPNTNEPLLLGHTGENYLYLPGVAGNYASTPDANALDITGDIDIRVRVALDDYSRAYEALLFKGTSGNRTYQFSTGPSGTLYAIFSTDGTTPLDATSSAHGLANGATSWLRVTRVAATGVIEFFRSSDGVTWTSLGSTTKASGNLATNTLAVHLGAAVPSGTSDMAAGKFYRAQVLDGINGTTVFDADFTQGITSGAQTTFTATTGQTVTINRSTAGRKSVAVVRPVWLLGTDDYFEVADNALLDFDAGDSFTVVAVVRQWATPTNFGRYVEKRQGGDFAGYGVLALGTTLGRQYLTIDDGPNGTDTSSGALNTFTAGQLVAISGVRDTVADTIRSFNNGLATASTAVTDTTTGSLANTGALRIGGSSTGFGNQDFECYAVAVFRRALTASEIATIAAYYGAV
jgi:hypothetical protein